jgi:murein DD-endopeptidase MepM/ murein hydrolase activator NlpD
MTGLATGPHLHYEILLNGENRYPLTVALPSPAPIPTNHIAAFLAQKTQYAAQLNLLRASNVASID